MLLHSVYHVLEPIVFAKLSGMGRLLVQCGEGRVFERETCEEMIYDIFLIYRNLEMEIKEAVKGIRVERRE